MPLSDGYSSSSDDSPSAPLDLKTETFAELRRRLAPSPSFSTPVPIPSVSAEEEELSRARVDKLRAVLTVNPQAVFLQSVRWRTVQLKDGPYTYAVGWKKAKTVPHSSNAMRRALARNENELAEWDETDRRRSAEELPVASSSSRRSDASSGPTHSERMATANLRTQAIPGSSVIRILSMASTSDGPSSSAVPQPISTSRSVPSFPNAKSHATSSIVPSPTAPATLHFRVVKSSSSNLAKARGSKVKVIALAPEDAASVSKKRRLSPVPDVVGKNVPPVRSSFFPARPTSPHGLDLKGKAREIALPTTSTDVMLDASTLLLELQDRRPRARAPVFAAAPADITFSPSHLASSTPKAAFSRLKHPPLPLSQPAPSPLLSAGMRLTSLGSGSTLSPQPPTLPHPPLQRPPSIEPPSVFAPPPPRARKGLTSIGGPTSSGVLLPTGDADDADSMDWLNVRGSQMAGEMQDISNFIEDDLW